MCVISHAQGRKCQVTVRPTGQSRTIKSLFLDSFLFTFLVPRIWG